MFDHYLPLVTDRFRAVSIHCRLKWLPNVEIRRLAWKKLTGMVYRWQCPLASFHALLGRQPPSTSSSASR